MGGEPVAQDWELFVGRDLAASLIPHGQLRRLQRPVDPAMVPGDAYHALAGSVGRHGLEDVLLVPTMVRPAGSPRHRRCRYAPMCVLGIGERGLGLWTGAPPPSDVRVALPFDDIATIERYDDGSWRRLTVTGDDASFSVCYDDDGDASANIWTHRLRLRCAGSADSPGDEALVAKWRSLLGLRSCQLAVTAREIIFTNSFRVLIPWRRRARVLYVPRGAVTEAAVTSRTLRLRSAGTDVSVRLPSRGLAASASRWLERPLAGGHPCPSHLTPGVIQLS